MTNTYNLALWANEFPNLYYGCEELQTLAAAEPYRQLLASLSRELAKNKLQARITVSQLRDKGARIWIYTVPLSITMPKRRTAKANWDVIFLGTYLGVTANCTVYKELLAFTQLLAQRATEERN